MDRSTLLERFTEQKQSFIKERRMDRKLNFVVQTQNVTMNCSNDLNLRFDTNDMGFQTPRKAVLLGA